MDSYLAAEPLIVARLCAALPQHDRRVRVQTAPDLQGVKEAGQPTPRVDVLYHGDSQVEPQGGGLLTSITQTWICVICIDNVAGLRQGAEARQDAGKLGLAVRQALTARDWSPGEGLSRLEQIASPYAASYSAGRMYLPLAFRTSFQLRS
jgi:hypothetical protein